MKSIDILWGKVEDIIKEDTERVAPAIGIGSVLSDGYIVYSQTATEWLAVAPANKRTDCMWGTSETAKDTISTRDGHENTNMLQAFGADAHPAAHYCWNNSRNRAEGGTGSYLPSKDELDIIYENKKLIDVADTSGGEFTLAAIENNAAVRPNVVDTTVWSSTENTGTNSWFQSFSCGTQFVGYKFWSSWVIPMRRINKQRR